MPPHAPVPTPTRIVRVSGESPFAGGEIWVSGLFPDMAQWMRFHAVDVQVARLQLKDFLCCPGCRMFETSTSNKFWAGVVESPIHLFILLALRFWHQGISQVPLDDFTSSRAQVNCLKNSLHNCVHAVPAVLHLNVNENWELEERAEHCLKEILRSLAGGKKVGVTLSHTGATRAMQGESKKGKCGWFVGGGGGPQCPCNRFLVGMEGGRAGSEGSPCPTYLIPRC